MESRISDNRDGFMIKQPKSYDIDINKITDEVDCINILRILIDGMDIKVSDNYRHFDLVKKYLIINDTE